MPSNTAPPAPRTHAAGIDASWHDAQREALAALPTSRELAPATNRRLSFWRNR